MNLSCDDDQSSFWTTAFCVACAVVSGGSYMYGNLQSQTKQTVRNQALTTVTQHVASDTCWTSKNKDPKQPFKIGDEISLEGSKDGRSPTGCFFNPATNQYAQGQYLNDQLVVSHVFSKKEVKGQIGASKNDKPQK